MLQATDQMAAHINAMDDQYRNQTDHKIRNRMWGSFILSAEVRLREDSGTDHELLLSKIRVMLKKSTKLIIVSQYILRERAVKTKANFLQSACFPSSKNNFLERCDSATRLVN